MRNTFIIWEAPRLRGTCLCQAIINGLSSSGKTVKFMDEPLHWRRFHPRPVPPEIQRLDYLFEEVSKASEDAVVLKMQVKHLFEYAPPANITRHPLFFNSRNLILVRDTFGALASHYKALRLMTDIPTDLTVERTGIPHLYKFFKVLQESSTNFMVVDTDVLANRPYEEVSLLAVAIGIPFSSSMTSWSSVTIVAPPWGTHWYTALRSSTGWRAPEPVAAAERELLGDLWRELNPLMLEMRNANRSPARP